MKWWEKTVEYAFVRRYVSEDALLAGLDGPLEVGFGDAVFEEFNRLILLEFKKDAEAVTAEPEKLSVSVARALGNSVLRCDRHHILVYGGEVGGRFRLFAKTYFTGFEFENTEAVFDGAVAKEHFKKYLVELNRIRKSGGDPLGGGGGARSTAVAAVDREGNVVGAMSLNECLVELGMVQRQLQRSRGRSGPDLGM
jgi:hypothetical protein